MSSAIPFVEGGFDGADAPPIPLRKPREGRGAHRREAAPGNGLTTLGTLLGAPPPKPPRLAWEGRSRSGVHQCQCVRETGQPLSGSSPRGGVAILYWGQSLREVTTSMCHWRIADPTGLPSGHLYQ